MRSLLDHQADGIEYTLHTHGIEACVVGGNISPRLIQFHIKLGSGMKFSRVAGLADELALALGVTSCRITRDGHHVKVEVPRPDPVAVRLFPLMRTLPGDLPVNAPILGLDENGVPLLLRLNSPDIGHILISGTTGSGKTALARSMIASLALQNPPEQLRLLLIDPKSRGYRQFNGLPNLVCPVVTDPLDGLHRVRWAVRHMEKRDEMGVSTPALAIFIDELADLMMVNGREMENAITRLTQRGREAGIHIIACTQKPAASVIGSIAKSNFPTRIVGKVVSAEDAKVASGVAGSGADKLMGRGDFLLFSANEVVRLQGAYLSPAEMEQTVAHLGGNLEPVQEQGMLSRAKSARTERQMAESYADYDRYDREGNYSYEKQPAYAEELEEDFDPTDYKPKADYNKYGYGQEAMGISERFAQYQRSIINRRRTITESKPAQDEVPYQTPAKAYAPVPEPEVEVRPARRPAPEPEMRPVAHRPEPKAEEPVSVARPKPKRKPEPVAPAPVEEPKVSRLQGYAINREALRPVPKPQPKLQPRPVSDYPDLWDEDFEPEDQPDQENVERPRPVAKTVIPDGGKRLIDQLQENYKDVRRTRAW